MTYILSYRTRKERVVVPFYDTDEDAIQEIVLNLYASKSVRGKINVFTLSELSDVFEADYHQLEVE